MKTEVTSTGIQELARPDEQIYKSRLIIVEFEEPATPLEKEAIEDTRQKIARIIKKLKHVKIKDIRTL